MEGERFDFHVCGFLDMETAKYSGTPARGKEARAECLLLKAIYMDKRNLGLGLLFYTIADCVRMCFSSARNR
jgi:hypothetical protein